METINLGYKILTEEVRYTGRELRSGWVSERTGLSGDAAAAFIGPCDVATEDLVDMDDKRAGAIIRSDLMAHVILEHPSCPIEKAVLRQRLLVCTLCEILVGKGYTVLRDGDDVYIGERKLTVSIAAPSEGRSLIHLGINIKTGGAPVPAIGLEEMKLPPQSLLAELLERYVIELASCSHAETKVRQVP